MAGRANPLAAEREDGFARLALEGIPAGVAVLNPEGQVLYASASFRRLSGLDGRATVQEVENSSEPLQSGLLAVLREACSEWKPASRLVAFDLEHRHYLYVAAQPQVGETGAQRMAAMAIDLTEAVIQGDVANEFIRQVRHDLRSPLTSIQGAIELLLSERVGPLVDPRQKRLLTIMERALQSMTTTMSKGSEEPEPPRDPSSRSGGGG